MEALTSIKASVCKVKAPFVVNVIIEPVARVLTTARKLVGSLAIALIILL
jgi:hypothetical protein